MSTDSGHLYNNGRCRRGQWSSLGRRQSALFVLLAEPHKLGKTELKRGRRISFNKETTIGYCRSSRRSSSDDDLSLEAQRCQSFQRNKVGRLYVNEGF